MLKQAHITYMPSLAIDTRRSLSACPHRQFYTLPGLLDSWGALLNSYPKTNGRVPSRETVCIIFMIVFGMTRPRRKPATYRMRGGHANN